MRKLLFYFPNEMKRAIFAIYGFDEIYFKVGKNNLSLFLEKNSKIFEYEKKGRKAYISYYTLPEEIMENKENLDFFIKLSLEAEK